MGRVLIAGTHSGCGKTTVTTGLLYALSRRGADVSAFKCGPDYIDPMFHRKAIGIPSYNLDAYFLNDSQLRQHLSANSGKISIIEGVMGYYDGIGIDGTASTFHIAMATNTPAILVINARGMYTSAGAFMHGFLNYRKSSGIRGVIFNGISSGMYKGLSELAEQAGVTPMGFLPYSDDIHIGSRHLGLITADELPDLSRQLARLGDMAEQYIDINKILKMADTAPELDGHSVSPVNIGRVPIAVAQDEAFCFMYRENIQLLENMGADIIPFSPIRDACLPHGTCGLYLCGGYPELYAAQLSQNKPMLRSIHHAIAGGLPTIAECGGFLYLHDFLDDNPMAGIIHDRAHRTDRLQHFGYATLTANRDNLLCRTGDSIPVHEFHYYESSAPGCGFTAKKASSGTEYSCIHCSDTMYAGFPHLYLPANPACAESFIRKAISYAAGAH